MKKFLCVGLPIVLVILLSFLFSGDRTNPEIQNTINWYNSNTKNIFYKACADCHSHETKWPWYSYFAPVSWIIIKNVNEGREIFNISSKEVGEADYAAEVVKKGEMPPSDYLITHPEAKLSKRERSLFIKGLIFTFGK